MDLKAQLLDFLVHLPEVDGPDKRKALVTATGFSSLGIYLDWQGANVAFFPRLLDELGKRGQDTLLQFLDGLAPLPYLGAQRRDDLARFHQAVAALSDAEWRAQFGGAAPAQDASLDVDMVAASVVSTVLTPYLALGGDALQTQATAGAVHLAEQVWDKVQQAFAADPAATGLLRVYARSPQAVQAEIAPLLRDKLAADPALAQEMADLLTDAKTEAAGVLRTLIGVSQRVGTVQGDVIGAIFGADVLPQGVDIEQEIDRVEPGGTAVGGVSGGRGRGSTTVGSQRIDTGGGAYVGGGVNTGGGSFTGRDSGDHITTGDISNSTAAIGRHARATSSQGLGGADIAALFAQVYQQIEQRPVDPQVDREEIEATVRRIQAEAEKGQDANPGKVERWLNTLLEIAPDVLEVVAGVLINPVTGVGQGIRAIAQRMRR